MTRSIEQNNKHQNTYGGLICFSDFYTYFPSLYSSPERGSSIAQRIANDVKFDKQCGKNILERKRGKKNSE